MLIIEYGILNSEKDMRFYRLFCDILSLIYIKGIVMCIVKGILRKQDILLPVIMLVYVALMAVIL
jgi:hypothetical protein